MDLQQGEQKDGKGKNVCGPLGGRTYGLEGEILKWAYRKENRWIGWGYT